MGIVPIWGAQLIVAIALSILFRLNKALVILAANISLPPMIPIILYLSHLTGKIWMGEKAVNLSFSKGITLENLRNSFLQYVAGAITLSVISGLIAAVVSFALLGLFNKRKAQV